MSTEQFENTLRQLVRREPFQTFFVEMLDGSIIEVDRKVAFGGGAASFISRDDEWVDFACEDVKAFRTAVPGASV